MQVIQLIFLLNSLFAFAEDSSCKLWFKKLEMVTASGCESYCRSSKTDMSTFMCPDECPKLCKTM